THLPRSVYLVAQCPVLNFVGLFASVLSPLVGPVGMTWFIAVLDPMPRIVDRSQSGVNANVRFGADEFAIAQKLISAEAIALQIVPGEIYSDRALVLRPDPILPVISRREIATGPAQN